MVKRFDIFALGTLLIVVALIIYGKGETSASTTSTYICMDFDGRSSYEVKEWQLVSGNPMVKGKGYVEGTLVTLYIPKSNLIGCVEIENAQ